MFNPFKKPENNPGGKDYRSNSPSVGASSYAPYDPSAEKDKWINEQANDLALKSKNKKIFDKWRSNGVSLFTAPISTGEDGTKQTIWKGLGGAALNLIEAGQRNWKTDSLKKHDIEAGENLQKNVEIQVIGDYNHQISKGTKQFENIEEYYNSSLDEYNKDYDIFSKMPINSQDYEVQRKKLMAKRQSTIDIKNRMNDVGREVGGKMLEKEEYEDARGIANIYFDDDRLAKRFVSDSTPEVVIDANSVGGEDNAEAMVDNIKTAQERAMNAYIKGAYSAYGETQKRAGYDFDSTLLEDSKIVKTYLTSMGDLMISHYDEIFPGGRYDAEAFQRISLSDPRYTQLLDTMNDGIGKKRMDMDRLYYENRGDSVYADGFSLNPIKVLESFHNEVMEGTNIESDWGKNVRGGYRSRRINRRADEGKESNKYGVSNFSFNLINNMDDQWGFKEMAYNVLTKDPLALAQLPLEIAMLFSPAGISSLLKAGKITKGAKLILNTKKAVDSYKKSRWLKLGGAIGRENVLGFALDTHIDSFNKEGSVVMNSMFNGLGGLIGRGDKLSKTNGFMKQVVENAGDTEKQLEILGGLGGGFTKNDMKDTEKLWDKIDGALGIFNEGKGSPKGQRLKDASEKIDNVSDVDFIEKTAETVKSMETGTTTLGEAFKGKFDTISKKLEKYKATTDAAKKEKIIQSMKKDLKEIMGSVSNDTVEEIYNIKIKTNLKNSAVNDMYEKAFKLFKDKNLATYVAIETVLGDAKNVDEILKKIGKKNAGAAIDLASDAGKQLIEDGFTVRGALKALENQNIVKLLQQSTKRGKDIIKTISKFSKEEKAGYNALAELSDNAVLKNKGLDTIGSDVISYMGGKTYAKTQSIIGTLYNKLKKGSVSFLGDIKKISKNIYKSMPDLIKKKMVKVYGKNAEKIFADKALEYMGGGAAVKQKIIKEFKDAGIVGADTYLQDAVDIVGDVVDAVKTLHPEKNIDELLSKAKIKNIAESIGNKGNLKNIEKYKITKVMETLLAGLGGLEGENTIQALKTVAVEISRALDSGMTPNLPASFLSHDGRKLLNMVFEDVKGYSPDILKRAFRKSQSRMSAYKAKLADFLTNDGKLLLRGEAKGGKVSLREVLKGIDLRLTEEGIMEGAVQGGIIYSHGQVLTKYIVLSESKSFFRDFAKIINARFKKLGSDGITVGESLRHYSGVGVNAGAGDILMATYKKIDAELFKMGVKNAADRADILHPLLFNPDEYLLGVRYSEDAGGTLLYTLAERHAKVFKGTDVGSALEKIIRETPENLKNFSGYPKGAETTALRNKNANEIEKILWDFAEENSVKWKIKPALFDQYINTISGYFTAADGVGYSYSAAKSAQRGIKASVEAQRTAKKISGPAFRESNKLLDDLLTYSSDSGHIEDLGLKIDEYKQFLKDNDLYTDDVGSLLKSYMSNIHIRDAETSAKIYTDQIVNATTTTPKKTKKVFQGYDEILNDIESTEIATKRLEESTEIANNNMITRALTDPKNLKNGLRDIYSMGVSLGLGTEEMTNIVMKYGVSESVAKTIANGGSIDEKGIKNIIETALVNGDMAFFEAMENKVFREAVNDSLASAEKGEKGISYKIDKYGNTTLAGGDDIGTFWKGFISLNTLGKEDEEVGGIISRMLTKSKGSISGPKFKYGKWTERMGNRAYVKNAKKVFADAAEKAKIDDATANNMLKEVFSDDRFSPKTKKYKLLVAEDATDVERAKAELYDMLIAYRDDLSKIRGETPAQMWSHMAGNTHSDRKGAITTRQFAKNWANRLGGEWVYTSADDMVALKNKMEIRGKTYLNAPIGEFTRDILYGGLFDRTIWSNLSGIMTKASLFQMFNPMNIFKMPQQMINNVLDGTAGARYMTNDSALYKALEDHLAAKIDINIYKSGAKDIAKGTSDGEISKIVDKVLQGTSILNRADSGTKSSAVRRAVADGFFPIVERDGLEAVEEFAERFSEMNAFMDKYGIDGSSFYYKDHAIQQIGDIALANGEDITGVMEKFDGLAQFYKNDLKKLEGRARMSYASFYATDVIPELSSTRIVDNQRAFFALKKWAMSRFAEYGYEISNDIKRFGYGGFIERVAKGESHVFTKISEQMITGMRFGFKIDRVTDGEISTLTAMEYLAVPAVVVMMTIGDTAGKMRKDVKAYNRNVGDNKSGMQQAGDIGSILVGNFISGIGATAWLYQEKIAKDIAKAVETGKEVDHNAAVAGLTTFLKNSYMRPLTKYFNSNYGGYEFTTDTDGSFVTDLFKAGLNMQSTLEKDQQQKISDLYMSDIIAKGGAMRFIQNSMYGLLPLGSRYSGLATADVGVLNGLMRDWKSESGVDMFLDKYANVKNEEKFMGLLAAYDIKSLESKFNSDDNKSKLEAKGISFDTLTEKTDEELILIGLQTGIISSNAESAVFTDTLSALKGKKGISQDVNDSYMQMMDPDDKVALVGIAEKLWTSYAKDSKQKKGTFMQDYLNSVGELGTNYTMAGYLQAARLGVKKSIQDSVGIKDNEFKFGVGDQEIDGVTISNVNGKDVEFFTEYTRAQRDLLADSWKFIGGNGMVGMDLTNTFYTNDLDKPTKSYTKKMELVSNMEMFKQNLYDEGYLTENVMAPFDFHYLAVAQRVATAPDYDPDDKKNVYHAINNVAIDFVQTIDENIKDPYQNVIAKAGLAFSISPVINKMNSLHVDNLKTLVDSLGEGFTVMIDSLTSASPNDAVTAFEITTGINTHLGAVKPKVEKLKSGHNAAVKLATTLGKLGYKMSPVKYNLASKKGKLHPVEIDVVKIDVPRPPTPEMKDVLGESAKTPDLRVKGSSVTKKAFTSGKTRPKSIKSIKIYKKLKR